MAGRHPFATLRARMSPKARAEAEVQVSQLDEEMNLAEVRRALQLSQDEIAQTLQIGQGSVAKIEKRADMVEIAAASAHIPTGKDAFSTLQAEKIAPEAVRKAAPTR